MLRDKGEASVKEALATGLSSAVEERERYAKIACGLVAVER